MFSDKNTFQVKGLSDGGVDGLNRAAPRDGGRPNSRAWSPPGPPDGFKKDRDLEQVSTLGPRPTSPSPSGRIKADSQLTGQMPPPIFSSHYRGEHSLLYQRFPFPRAETTSLKPTSTSSLGGFPAGGRKAADLPSPGRDSGLHYSKFSDPLRGEREDFEGSGPAPGRGGKSPGTELEPDRDRERSPLGNNSQRPHSSSSDQFEMSRERAKQMTSDSSTEKGVSPGGQNSRRYPDVDCERGRQSNDHVKTELASSPPGPETKTRTFSGDFSRESLSRLSQSSGGSRSTEGFISQTAQGEFSFPLLHFLHFAYLICIGDFKGCAW